MARRQRSRKVAVALPAMETAPEHWLRHIRLSGFAVTVLFLIIVTIVILAPSLRTLVAQEQEIAALRQAVIDKQHSVDDLTQNVARWDDPAYIEAQARDRLLYVRKGEHTYLIVDDGKTVKTDDGAPVSDTIQTTKVDWMDSLLSTVVTAGVTDATADDLEKK